MVIRTFWFVVFAASCAAVAWVGSVEAASARRPNFLFVLADNLGKDWIGCYGADGGHTPQIDQLAASGVRFERCYTTAYCSTTRVELLTGRYGFRTGWTTHHDAAIYGGGGLDPQREKTFAHLLRSAGYATCITGKWQVNDLYAEPDALARHGFDEHLVWTGAMVGQGTADERYQASLSAGRALESRYWDPVVFRNGERMELRGKFGPDVYLEYLEEFMTRHRDESFLAYYATPLVHVPTVTTPLSPNAAAPEREQFVGMLSYLDQQIGRLVETLDRLGLRENTVLVFVTDNGSPARLGGSIAGVPVRGGLGTLVESGIDVPLIVNCPGRIPSGQVSKALVDCSDFLPTLLELAQVGLPHDIALDGRSFARLLTGGETAPRSWIFTEYAHERVVRDQRYKLFSSGKLYDLVDDPSEKMDLASSVVPEMIAVRNRLQAVLDGLPPDAKLPFEPRSQSAFKLRGN
ncbi:MAG TPA: sulfatase-like hydrolase/transferase [Pirellulales bacterium]|nr:sulfatase-like hydrolase/transferase [Pirellulales bacterium]